MQFAGITLLTCFCRTGEHHHIINVLGAPLPQAAVKASLAAVQVVAAVIGSQLVLLAVQGEFCPGNTVGHPAYCSAKVRGLNVICNGITPQGDILHHALFIRHTDAMHSRPVIEKVYLHGVVVKQGKACYRLPFRRPAKKVLIDHWLLLTFRLFLPIIVPHQRPTAKGEVFTLARSSGRISAEGWHRAAGCFGTAETDGHSPSRPSKGRLSLRPALPPA